MSRVSIAKPTKATLEAEVVALLDALDATDDGNPKAKQRRKYERLKYRCGPIPVDLVHPGGSATKVNAFTRNISSGGVCFLTAGFVHPGTKCTIGLLNVMGRQVPCKGVVRWCTHVSGRMHQVGATFQAPIDPRQYVAASAYRDPSAQSGANAGQVVPAKILFVNDEPLDRELMNMTVRNSPMKVESVGAPPQALEALAKELYDVVIVDLNHGEQSVELIRAARAKGFRGPVLLLTCDTNSPTAKGSIDAGADEVVRKPYDAGMLLMRVSNQIRARNMPTGDSPIYSDIEDVLAIAGPVSNYIEAARKKLADVDKALAEGNVELAAGVCEVLMATGTGFGFPIVTDCATLALWTLNEAQSVAAARDELRRLAQVINRLTVKTAPEGPPPGSPAEEKKDDSGVAPGQHHARKDAKPAGGADDGSH